MMMLLMMMMCKRLAQVPKLCVPIYNMKLAMMQKTTIFTTFSAHTKIAADKRRQIEVFARIYIYIYLFPQTLNRWNPDNLGLHVLSLGHFSVSAN